MKIITILISISSISVSFAAEQSQAANKKGLDFMVIGDYGWIRDLQPSKWVFDKMNWIIGNASTP